MASTLHTSMTFYTTPPEDAGLIQRWLDENVEGVKPRAFYASFINWCISVAGRVRNPAAKYSSPEAQQTEQEVLAILRTHPCDTAQFIRALEAYTAASFTNGNLKKGMLKPEYSGEIAVNAAQKRLLEAVFSRAERREIERAKGNTMPNGDVLAKGRSERKRAKRLAGRQAAMTEGMAGLDLEAEVSDDEEEEEEGGVAVEGGRDPIALPAPGEDVELTMR